MVAYTIGQVQAWNQLQQLLSRKAAGFTVMYMRTHLEMHRDTA